jgi:hypothetical protein
VILLDSNKAPIAANRLLFLDGQNPVGDIFIQYSRSLPNLGRLTSSFSSFSFCTGVRRERCCYFGLIAAFGVTMVYPEIPVRMFIENSAEKDVFDTIRRGGLMAVAVRTVL